MKRMLHKTYNNVMTAARFLEREKGYPEKEAVELALLKFDAMEAANKAARARYSSDKYARPVSCWLYEVLSYEEYKKQYC